MRQEQEVEDFQSHLIVSHIEFLTHGHGLRLKMKLVMILMKIRLLLLNYFESLKNTAFLNGI